MKKLKTGKYEYQGYIIEKKRIGTDPKSGLSSFGWYWGKNRASKYSGMLREYAVKEIDKMIKIEKERNNEIN